MKFIHTADWQLGLKLRYVTGDSGAEARLRRFDAVRRIAEIAKDRKVHAVLVAGDVFDDNAVGNDTIQAASDALKTFAPIPVILLPGNHDPASANSALRRLDGLAHVIIADSADPIAVGDAAAVFPCPLTQRHESTDPTTVLEERGGDRRIRIALAHGGLVEFSENTETPNKIDFQRVLDHGFDYLALGDWHGTLNFGDRVWYSGTHEPTRFKEKDPGNILLVDIAETGAKPAVEKIPVAYNRWISQPRMSSPSRTGLATLKSAVPPSSSSRCRGCCRCARTPNWRRFWILPTTN
jgi:DNA repair exonuclease SbcCD nuclease subunit